MGNSTAIKERRKNIKPKFINIEYLSRYTTMSINTLYAWVNQRKIPYYKIGEAVRFNVEEIDEWIRVRKVEEQKF